ncbi:MAG: zinc ribbon domain-containing protein [Methanomassiliicoccaceae archaeon]|nr:zinc ribbon domain-containing protein [Methanomassiliicoccaceae archaeon]
MDENRKSGFQRFRETSAAQPIGMVLALAAASLLVAAGFVTMLGGLCIAIIAYFILRLFRVKKIEHQLIFAAVMLAVFTLELIYLPQYVIPDGTSMLNLLADVLFVLVLPFVLIVMIVWWMRRNLERTRERLEREGRLYPQGYGRCSRCGTVVLPGEVCCRKCGEYIDVPEDLRVKKANYFECSECGREVPEDAGVCPYCGEAFESDDP